MGREAGRQAITVQKNVAAFRQTILIGKVDVIKFLGYRCTLIVSAQYGGFNGVAVHGSRLTAGKVVRF